MNLFDVNNDVNYLLTTMGKTILINETNATAIIQNKDTTLDIIKIITKSLVKMGDIITYNNNYYLVITEVTNKKYDCFYKCEARHMPDIVKFKFDNTVKSIPFFADAKIFDIANNKLFNTENGQMDITMQNNNKTSQIYVQERFIKFGGAWEITGKNCTQKGLICLSCTTSQFVTQDDKINEIAYQTHGDNTPIATTDLVINGSTTLTIDSQNTYTLKNKDGTAVTTGTYTWSITYNPDDVTIVSQNNTTCVLKGVKYGAITLSVTDNINTYTKNIQVQKGGW